MFKYSISIDLSGTYSTVGISKETAGRIEIVCKKRMKTANIVSVKSELNEFISKCQELKQYTSLPCCISVAGILNKEKTVCELTNANLVVDLESIKKENFFKPVIMINDFEAIGYGIDHLMDKDIIPISNPPKNKEKTKKEVRAVIGAGTGLGKTIMVYDRQADSSFSISSAGGHGDLPVTNKFELELANWIQKDRGGDAPIEYEDVLSGRGIERIYRFLEESRNRHQTKKISAQWISQNVNKNDLCTKTFELFITFYARALRNFALEVMPIGGLFIAGGIAMKNPIFFQKSAFMREFEKNYTHKQLLQKIPISLIVNYDVSLLGAAAVASLSR
ncbi:glucokinase [Candidatus Magnetomorum sp. HK-1]|nr:glucokinase [Candidatus Magnetomorum sp. HK-1]